MSILRRILLASFGLALLFAVAIRPAHAQTNVSARYAKGQVWVTWTPSASPPETYAIYASTTPFTSTNQATLVGRLFDYEWRPEMLILQAGPWQPRWVVPHPVAGVDTLALNTSLFVDTPVTTATRYYAVVAWGDTVVTAGVNLSGPVTPVVSLADPPQPVAQYEYVKDGQWLVTYYLMWVRGSNSDATGRPDFPVMANAAKNGMPCLFMLSRPVVLPPGNRPLVHWLHGGSGSAMQSTPGFRNHIDIDPDGGFLVAHNDRRARHVGSKVATDLSNTWWFGWARTADPFDSTYVGPAPGDTIVDYTLRRLNWTHQWLLSHFPIDEHRVALQGHSMGSAGSTVWAKTNPELFSTVTIFNNGFEGPNGSLADLEPGEITSLDITTFGLRADLLPTLLRNPGGQSVPWTEIYDLTHPISPQRDLPLWRVFHAKHDDNPVMHWDANVVAQFEAADASGHGYELWWDEGVHSPGEVPSYFHGGVAAPLQTGRDDVVYQWRYRNDQSYPAFYDHRLYPNSHDPGDGTPGTTADSVYSGDDWGAWGGFHDWEPDSIVDTPTVWSTKYWLITGSTHLPDNAPHDSLLSRLAIRRPQAFTPAPGTPLFWFVRDAANAVVQTGYTIVESDGLVKCPLVMATKWPEWRRVTFTTVLPPNAAAGGAAPRALSLTAAPSVVRSRATLSFALPAAGRARLSVHDVQGRCIATLADGEFAAGEHRAEWNGAAPAGLYFARLISGGETRVVRLARVR